MNAHLPPRAWTTAPATLAVVAALEAAGGSGCARFVGGCVRDALLGLDSDDVDIATTLEPPAVIAALTAAGLKAVPTGVEHGTVTAVSGGRPFEVTTLRRDVETDGRRAVVAFSTDWAEDAARRDFGLNALYAEPSGAVHDPTGRGLSDLGAGRVAFVGDPATRIAEDALRILRFFRFTAWFGREGFDASGLAACTRARGDLAGLSAERVSKELLKLLAAEDPRPAVRAMADAGVLAELLPEAPPFPGALARFEALVEIERGQLFEVDALLRLAALLPDDAPAMRGAAERLRLSNAQRDRLAAAASDVAEPLVSWMSPREIRRAIHRLGPQAFRDRVKLSWAADGRTATAPQWRLLHVYPETWSPPPFPLSGQEISAAGVPQGPLHGRVRREVERWWIDLDFTDDKWAALERLKAVAQGLVY